MHKIWIAVLIGLSSAAVEGARAPNATEKILVFSGEGADAAARFLGLSAESPVASLRLGGPDEWAIYLLKQDTQQRLWNSDDDRVPARYNRVEYLRSQIPELVISGYWLDWGTKLPNPMPDYYAFGSAFVPGALAEDDPWTELVRTAMKHPNWDANGSTKFDICFSSQEGSRLCFKILEITENFAAEAQKGFAIYVTTHMRP